MRRFRLLLLPAGLALGLTAEWAFYGWNDVRHWLPDLAVGWSFIVCGLVAWSRRPESRSGPLLTLAGFAWFAGNFATTGVAALDWLSAHALYLYRGPLVHLVLTYPRGRVKSRLDAAAVSVGYVVAVVTPVWQSEVATIVLAVALVLVAARGYALTAGRERRERLAALQASAGLALVLGIGAAHLAVSAGSTAWDATLLVYEVSLSVLAVVLLAGLLEAPWEGREMSDLVVELGETRSGTLRDALARALGDPTLRIAYRLPGSGVYVDAAGRPVDLPPPGSGSALTPVERDGEPIAVLVHDPAVLDDPGLVAAVAATSRLAASNAQLQAEVRAQLAELEAARRRLVESGDRERRRLEQRLHEGAERRLLALGEELERARRNPEASEDAKSRVEGAAVQLERTLAEIGELARGLHPRTLTEQGLGGALRSLASRSPVPVDLAVVDGGPLPDEVEAAAYFVCSEAIANVAKYASASRVRVAVAVRNGSVEVEVADDGVGDADPARGTGLAGLADRVEALGGRLVVESEPGSGTRVRAEMPLGRAGSAQ